MKSDAPAPKSVEELTEELLEKGCARDAEKSQFDYIIVGSGAGGGPLASRLALAGKKVLVIEAGGDPALIKYPDKDGERLIEGEVTRIPGYYGPASEDAEMSWMFSVRHHADDATQREDAKYNKNIDPNTGGKIPEKYLDAPEKGRKQGVFYPRCSGIGGCTGHHAMITIRPDGRDWDYIADLTGDDSWRADAMRGYFAKLERNQYIDAYDRFLANLLGVLYKIWRRIVLFVDPRAVLDEGGHGRKGWAPTNLIDPFLVSMIAKEDQPFFKVIVRAALGALHGRWSPITWIKGQLVRSRVVPAIDFNDVNTRRTHSQGVFLIPLGIEGENKERADGETAQGRRFGVREFLLSTRFDYPDRLVIKSGAHVTRVLFAPDEKGGPPRAIGVECAIGDHLYEASPKQNLNPSKARVAYFVKKEVGEVILCGGAFNTPQLLMLSGIGEKAHLAEKEIKGLYGAKKDDAGDYHAELFADAKVIDLPGVGCNLQDRYEVTVVSELDHELTTLQKVSFEPGDKKDLARQQWLRDRTGLYTTNGGTLAVIRVSKPAADGGEDRPDLFTFGAPAAFRGYYWNWSRELFRETLGAGKDMRRIWSWVILKAYTRNDHGTVRLRTASPFDMPEICFDVFNEKAEQECEKLNKDWRDVLAKCDDYARRGQPLPDDYAKLRDELKERRKENAPIVKESRRDLAAMVDAVAFMRKINARNPEQFIREIQPGPAIADNSREMENWIKTQAWGHHASCTCRIGSDPWQASTADLRDRQAVLDSHFRVHGVERLRVVDASVFPKIPGYFIVAPIFMISEKAADTLIQDATETIYPTKFREMESAAISERRKKANRTCDEGKPEEKKQPEEGTLLGEAATSDRTLPPNTVGLALSGGGIRSATFALGVLQALAHQNRLRHVDILSTVSGGGFAGSFLGRLFTRPAVKESKDPVGRVQDTLKNSRSAPLQWLRTQANYLFNAGWNDVQLNVAVFWRNIFSIYLVVGTLLFAVFGILAGLPRAVSWLFDYFGWFRLRAMLAPFFISPPFGGIDLSPWWWLPIFALVTAVLPLTLGYWLATRPGSYRPYPFFVLLAWLLALTGAIMSLLLPHGLRYTVGALLALVLAWLWQELARAGALPRGATEGARLQVGTIIRNRLARALGSAVTIFVALFLWVVLDTLALLFARRPVGVAIMSIVVALGPLLPLLRRLIMYGLRCVNSGKEKGFSLIRIAMLLGIPLGVLLVWAIDVLAHRLLVVAPDQAGWVILLTALFSLAVGRAFEFLNLSSLRNTYAARLRRTFQGASNPDRIYGETSNISRDVELAHPDDDMPFSKYHPERHGGPVHLINVCVNETVDFASERTVRERKGLPMCITPHGVSVGVRYFAEWTQPDELPKWQKRRRRRDGLDAEDRKAFEARRKTALKALQVSSDPNAFHVLKTTGSESAEVESLSLGDWISISGAAYSTGTGRATNLPLALCLGLLNIRLGYWWDSGILPQERPGRYPPNFWRRLKRYPSKLLTMQSMLLAEWIASFRGPSEWFWNLSDGGHFEVTGVYELLRRRVPFIVLSDAAEDPNYSWGEVGLLIQEAREDFGAEIRWLNPKRSGGGLPAPGWLAFFAPNETPELLKQWINPDSLGSLKDIIDREAPYHAALARVTYDGTDKVSWLLLLKPSLGKELSEDIINYGKDHKDFPQQSTFDQVFDDIQWESYRALGEQIGRKVIQPA
jgi:choline dehydrogenase-like flavoprotein